MAFLIAAGAAALLAAVPLWSRIRVSGILPAELDLRLFYGIIPLWQWKVRLDGEGKFSSSIRTFLLPAKSTLPAFLQKRRPKKSRHSAFALDLSIDRLSLQAQIPWEEGWESLQGYALAQAASFLADRGLYLHGTKPDIRIELAAPDRNAGFSGEAILRMHPGKSLIRTIRKALSNWNTRSKN